MCCLRTSATAAPLQIQTASLLQECIMVRDGLARLPEFFLWLATYLTLFFICAFVDCSVFLCLCTLCTIDIIIIIVSASAKSRMVYPFGTDSPGYSQRKGRTMVVVVAVVEHLSILFICCL